MTTDDEYGLNAYGESEGPLPPLFRFDVPLADEAQLRNALRLISFSRRYGRFDLSPFWWKRQEDGSILLRLVGRDCGADRRGYAGNRDQADALPMLEHLFGRVQNLDALDPTLSNTEDIDAYEALEFPISPRRSPRGGDFDESIALLEKR